MAGRRGADDSIIVALGGNVPAGATSVRQSLEAALQILPSEGIRVRRRSRFWCSAAWPDASQPIFLNGVALVATSLDPAETLAALHRIEARFGRVRIKVDAPRTLDLDLIAFGRCTCTQPLVLPHPRAAERLFVMGPLAELIPDWRHPLTGDRAADLAARATVGRDAAPVADEP